MMIVLSSFMDLLRISESQLLKTGDQMANTDGLKRTLASQRIEHKVNVVAPSDTIRRIRSGTSSFGTHGTSSASVAD